jgi:hypothetical protein
MDSDLGTDSDDAMNLNLLVVGSTDDETSENGLEEGFPESESTCEDIFELYDTHEARVNNSETAAQLHAENPVSINVNQSEFTITADPTRIGRMRRTRDISDIRACICGVPVSTDEVNEQKAAMCTERGCETQWVYISFDFEHVQH